MHKNVEVLFEVDGVKKKLNSIIGVKQGDLLGPELFTFYMAAVLETWRSLHSYDLCIMRSKEDFILTGRNHKTGGKNLNGKRFTEFAVSDREMPFPRAPPHPPTHGEHKQPDGILVLRALGQKNIGVKCPRQHHNAYGPTL